MTALANAGVALPTGWLWEDEGTYSRTIYANLFAAVTATLTATSLSAQAASRARSPALSAKASKAVEGAGIPTSTTVVSITSTTIVISQNANANNSSASLRICPWGNGDGSTTFNVPDHRYRTLVGRDNINNYPASRSSDFAGTHLSTTGGEEMHQLVTNEAVGRSGLDHDFAGICLVPA